MLHLEFFLDQNCDQECGMVSRTQWDVDHQDHQILFEVHLFLVGKHRKMTVWCSCDRGLDVYALSVSCGYPH